MRHLAVDFGTRRVGLAISDAGGKFAEPLDVWPATRDLAERVAELCRREGVQRLVVGLPLNMDGTSSWVTREAVSLGRSLTAATGLPVVYVDERLSSFEAEDQLRRRKQGGERLTRNDRKRRLDALSAAHFLREFLDGRLAAIDPDTL
ncbi:MAG: Holliday junction resolvase RuvX [Tepidisphaerales bacterium]